MWDPASNTVYAKVDEVLDQQTRYALIVTDQVQDTAGHPVEPSSALADVSSVSANASDFADAVRAAERAGTGREHIVAATLFTTQSVTTVLEKIHRQISDSVPAPARFDLASDKSRTVYPLGDVVSLNTFVSLLSPSVDRIAFGSFLSPDYETHPGEYFASFANGCGVPAPHRFSELYFNLYMPSGEKPRGGWPIAIYSHGGGENKNLTSMMVAGRLAAHGIATIAINAVGHGFGPQGTLVLALNSGQTVLLPAGGRGIDQDGDGVIGSTEGLQAMAPRQVIDDRDGFRQTVVDLMQLVRVIDFGMDVDGDGSPDLDKSRIYYYGHSLGAMWGTMFLAVEPNVRSGVLLAPGGSRITKSLNGIGGRNGYGVWLASRRPSLINTPGITRVDGTPVAPPFFQDEPLLPLGVALPVTLEDGRNVDIRSPVTEPSPGAIPIQEFFERVEWVMQSADPAVYARYLRKDPLPGTGPKNIIIQFCASGPKRTELFDRRADPGRRTRRSHRPIPARPSICRPPYTTKEPARVPIFACLLGFAGDTNGHS